MPASVPRGYRLTQAAAAPHAVTANRLVRGRKVVALQYARGFDSLDGDHAHGGGSMVRRRVRPLRARVSRGPRRSAWPATIPAGAFRGVTAQVVVAPTTTTPHLWAVKDGVLLTVAGSATAEELLAVAASLEPASR